MNIIRQAHLPHNTGCSAEIRKSQVIRISATTTVDFVFFKFGQSARTFRPGAH
jgi:hypothetical protein